MTLKEIRSRILLPEYSFLKNNPHLGNRVILLGLGGSYAYGTQIETSDLDIRGCALNSERELLGTEKFDQFISNETDTVIYSFNKLISLLTNCNPNVIELLGLEPEHYLYLSPIGQELLDNKNLFLSKRAFNTFGGYATAQLKRLKNTSNNGRRGIAAYNKLAKHMMHLVRLYFMCKDILQDGKIITYRESEHDFLMSIRAGRFLDNNGQPMSEFFEFVSEQEARLKAIRDVSSLPNYPDYDAIQNFMIKINRIAIEK